MKRQVNRDSFFHQLLAKGKGSVSVGQSDVQILLQGEPCQLILTTVVYFGGNYIPQSVREELNEPHPFVGAGLKGTLSVDEEEFTITLETREVLSKGPNSEWFIIILEDFCWLADQWRAHLDERDRNDRVYVYAG